MGSRRIGRLGVLGLLARSFYLQAAWNYETLQATGFAHALFPVGRRLSKDGRVPADFAARHLSLFNTNPVLASYVIGSAARMEEDVAAGTAAPEDVSALKGALAVPLAAAGDRFFWATLRPLAGMLGLLVAGVSGIAGAMVLVVVYNLFHLYYRARGILRGYALGSGVVNEVLRLNLVGLSAQLGLMGAFALGVLFVAAGLRWTGGELGPAFACFVAVGVVAGLLPDGFQKRITEVALCAGGLGYVLTVLGLLG